MIFAKGQTQPYGIIDTADLKLTSCDFEKDANVFVLFDKTEVKTDDNFTIITRHKRIKILSVKGLNDADLTITYYNKDLYEKISDLKAQTITLVNGKIKFTPVDPTLIYKQTTDKNTQKLVLNFSDVKVGSVIEYYFKCTIDYPGAVPDWDVQEEAPIRYNEYSASIDRGYTYKFSPRIDSPLVKNITETIRGAAGDSLGIHYL